MDEIMYIFSQSVFIGRFHRCGDSCHGNRRDAIPGDRFGTGQKRKNVGAGFFDRSSGVFCYSGDRRIDCGQPKEGENSLVKAV